MSGQLTLLVSNDRLRCYVQIDLKLGKHSHQDFGQMQMHLNYFDHHGKTEEELPTVGILFCDDKNDAVVEFAPSEDANIYPSKCQLILSSKQELVAQLEHARWELAAKGSGSRA
ncbi:MAG: DUF1016 domain-containing protein [Gammaproteobacteria bacterium]|nr:DUF1016 domain-containing protein [Gammaproteobacteria bacterium]MYE51679.1 DUF1016 domain-containing protein [Gammaproteobacteria bacterium]MYF10954.1 DUF1016 domain-containing protein [Gammaproteobacteria bacterium]